MIRILHRVWITAATVIYSRTIGEQLAVWSTQPTHTMTQNDVRTVSEFAYGLRHIRTVPHMYFVYKHKTPLRTKLVSFGWITTIIIRYVCIFALVVELKTQRPRGMYDLYVYFIYYTQRNTMKRNRNKLRWEWRATIPWILVAWITILSMEYRHQIFSERSSPKSTTNL